MLLRLIAWFAGFMALGIWACSKFEIDLSTNVVAIAAGVLAIFTVGATGRGRKQAH